ncbi:hypothetical protein EIP86_005364 [Pleurotus ostreatoroseus]|nr:hypothetical protein EIP86_005364 [Pleurotus ostreatoroseus]
MATRAQTLRKATASRMQAATSDVDSAQRTNTGSKDKENHASGSAGASAASKQEWQAKSTTASASHSRTRKVYCSLEWEGPEALEERQDTRRSATPAPRKQSVTVELVRRRKPRPVPIKVKKEEQERDANDQDASSNSSGDEYVGEKSSKSKGKAKAKRRTVTTDSETDSDDTKPKQVASPTATKLRRPSTVSQRTRTASVSASPEPERAGRRRKSTSTNTQPPPKRKRTDTISSQTPTSAAGGEDAARKYCLTKLQEIFCDIFLRYPILRKDASGDQGGEERQGDVAAQKSPDELTEEEKETLKDRASKFASDLEECMYELYSEPDKFGKHGVAAKYKERFRMISFNLSKPDRVVLHKRIAASHITPKELSTMSSTDLANEETKQSILQAEQEALAHSILKKTLMPRAKITHKGLQDIEDVNGEAVREEREREREEEERIERERQERLKLQAQRAQAAAGSVPPESPVTPHAPSWGAPPPVPLHAIHTASNSGDTAGARPPLNPLFIPSASDFATPAPVEQELNLADLINIDEDPGQEVSISMAQKTLSPVTEHTSAVATVPMDRSETSASLSPPPRTPSTGLSPFASRSAYPEGIPGQSFDLNAVWSAPASKEDNTPATQPGDDKHQDEPMHIDSPDEMKEASADVDMAGEKTEDHDFDMFLEGGEEEHETVQSPVTQEPPKPTFEKLPHVWNGKLSIPLDSTIPQEVGVFARQIGGRTLGGESTCWKVLFPADHLRIDGRVPVDKSAQYMTAMRLNPTKELIAVAFSPDSETSAAAFDALAKHLLAKGRHGLIFPWGNRPKEHHPGRELYIIPLQPSEALPDFVELLDELQLPTVRDATYMIGIWVLNRGKLVEPPPVTPTQAETPAVPAPAPPAGPTPRVPDASQLLNQLIPPAAQPPSSAPGQPPVNTAALAAEVASLTPDQIQLMLRTLAGNSTLTAPVQPPMQPAPPPIPIPPPMPAPTMQSWMAPPPNYQPPYPGPPLPPTAQPPLPPPAYGQPYPPPGGPQYEPYDSYDRGNGSGGGGGGGERRGGERSGRRSGRNWGRGRGQNQQTERPRDSGWRGRARARGQSSPGRGQRDAPRQWT